MTRTMFYFIKEKLQMEEINNLTDEQLLAMADTMDIPVNTPKEEKIRLVKELLKGLAALGKIPGFNVEIK